ncbi:MAG: cation diffusion facilitator family transporter [Acidimicrobiales bacterium]|nr:cation diffusion facilitator family transporter [Acidimicrobiales bacterium]
MHEGSRKAIFAALAANAGIAVAKLVGFVLTGAASLLAEAVHSLADTSNQALLLLGGSRSRRKASLAHPFGYGRERYFWAFIVALVLFLLGGVFAIGEGIDKLRHPHHLESLPIAVGILLVAVVLEGLSLRTAIHQASLVRGGESWWSFIRHSKEPELPVVLLEDTGALLGLMLALAGVGLGAVTDNARWDAVGSLGIGILLVVIAAVLVVEMKSLLIGESASPADVTAIERALAGSPGVRQVIHLRTEHIGPDELLVGAKVDFDHDLTLPEVAARIDEAEARLRTAVPKARVVYIEPDVARTEGVPATEG